MATVRARIEPRSGTRGLWCLSQLRAPALRIAAWVVISTWLVMVGGGCGGDGEEGQRLERSGDNRPCCPVCGDGVCSGDESGCNCSVDGCVSETCTAMMASSACGDGICHRNGMPRETHESCAADCAIDCRVCDEEVKLYYRGAITSGGRKCPEAAVAAHRVGDTIVCDSCESDRQCSVENAKCGSRSVGGCGDEMGQSCIVRECSLE